MNGHWKLILSDLNETEEDGVSIDGPSLSFIGDMEDQEGDDLTITMCDDSVQIHSDAGPVSYFSLDPDDILTIAAAVRCLRKLQEQIERTHEAGAYRGFRKCEVDGTNFVYVPLPNMVPRHVN